MDLKLTNQDLWISTVVFGGVGVALLIALIFVFGEVGSQDSLRALLIGSAVFWGVLGSVAMIGFWQLYYQYFYPAWVRWLAPLDLFLYGVIALGMWWLSRQIAGPSMLWFVLLGGLEGIIEHIVGIYAFQILERVPWLERIDIFPVLAFSFFEYLLYWTIVGWLAFIILKISVR